MYIIIIKISFLSQHTNTPALELANAAACDICVTEYNAADATEAQARPSPVKKVQINAFTLMFICRNWFL